MRTVNKLMVRSRFVEQSFFGVLVVLGAAGFAFAAPARPGPAAAVAGADSKADAYVERGAGMVVSAPDVGRGRDEQECPRIGGALSCASIFAQAEGTSQGELSPRYEPAPPQPKSSYNDAYIFGMTKGVADSTMHPAVKAPLFVLTIPLDIVTLPFTVIGGFFG